MSDQIAAVLSDLLTVRDRIDIYEKNILKQCFASRNVFYSLEYRVDVAMFESSVNRKIWETYMKAFKQHSDIHRSVIVDILVSADEHEYIPAFDQIINRQYEDEDRWNYHFWYCNEQYNKKKLDKLSDKIKGLLHQTTSEQIVREIEVSLNNVIQRDESVSFETAFGLTEEEIRNIRDGKKLPGYRTMDRFFDDKCAWAESMFVVIAAPSGVGKTRFLVDRMAKIFKNNPMMSAQWYSLEMDEKKMIRLFISKEARLDDYQLQSRNYRLSEDDLTRIAAAKNVYGKLDIDFHTHSGGCTISKIRSSFRRFCNARPGRNNILIIDNLRLIENTRRGSTEIDDENVKGLAAIRDETGALIIGIHHTAKEQESAENLKMGYRPLLKHMKGSTSYKDYADQVIMLHRPASYADLLKKEKAERPDMIDIFKRLVIADMQKNRNGAEAIIRYTTDHRYSIFNEWRMTED